MSRSRLVFLLLICICLDPIMGLFSYGASSSLPESNFSVSCVETDPRSILWELNVPSSREDELLEVKLELHGGHYLGEESFESLEKFSNGENEDIVLRKDDEENLWTLFVQPTSASNSLKFKSFIHQMDKAPFKVKASIGTDELLVSEDSVEVEKMLCFNGSLIYEGEADFSFSLKLMNSSTEKLVEEIYLDYSSGQYAFTPLVTDEDETSFYLRLETDHEAIENLSFLYKEIEKRKELPLEEEKTDLILLVEEKKKKRKKNRSSLRRW